jgi:hypothetical protein
MEMFIRANGSRIKCAMLMESITLLMEIFIRVVSGSAVNLLVINLVSLKEKEHLIYLA